jgi:6-phosphogluconolactonase
MNRLQRGALLFSSLLAVGCTGWGARRTPPAAAVPSDSPRTFVYVAGTGGEIDVLELDTRLGDLTHRGKSMLGEAVLSLAGPARGRLLVATTDSGGSVVSLSIDPATGALKSIGRTGVGGTEPMGAAIDASGRYVAVANRGSGNVSVIPIRQDGRLAGADTFAAGQGASAVGFHPSNTVAFVVNERAGTISQYSFNPGTGTLTPKPGQPLGLPWDSRPRQIRCHPNGRFVYVLSESNQTISVHAFDDRLGTLTRLAFQVVSTSVEGSAGAQKRLGSMRLGSGGKLLFVTNRGQNSVAVFAVDTDSGELTLRGHTASGGQDPIDVAVDPGGAFLVVANQRSRNLAMFRIAENGELQAAGALTLGVAPVALHALRPIADDTTLAPQQALAIP